TYTKTGRALAVLMVDIDHFKKLNDTYGHPIGDQVLVGVAQALKDNIRPSDFAARYGGEEFMVLLPDADDDAAQLVAERLREAVARASLTQANGEPLPSVTI